MVIHNTLTGVELHVPQGVAVSGTSTAIDLESHVQAYLINSDAGNEMVRINTVADAITIGNSTDVYDINLVFGASGELQIDGDAGTATYVLTSGGAGAPPTWSAAAGGGTAPFTITDNAATVLFDDGTRTVIGADLTNTAESLTYGHNSDSADFTHNIYGNAISLYGATANGNVAISRGDAGTGQIQISTASLGQDIEVSTAGNGAVIGLRTTGDTSSHIELNAAGNVTVDSGGHTIITPGLTAYTDLQDNTSPALRFSIGGIGSGDYAFTIDTSTGTEEIEIGGTTTNFDFRFSGSGDMYLPTGDLIDGAASGGASTDYLGHSGTTATWNNLATDVAATASVTANTAKVSADGSIETHSDVTVTTGAAGDILYNNGSAWVNLADSGTAGWFLQSDAAGGLSWAAAAGGVPLTVPDNAVSTSILEDDAGTPVEYISLTTTNGGELLELSSATTNAPVTVRGTGLTTLGGDLTVAGNTIGINAAGGFIIGDTTATIGTDSIVIGGGTATAGGQINCVIIGDNASTAAAGGTYIGKNAGATYSGNNGTSVGYASGAAAGATAVGYFSTATIANATSVGSSVACTASQATALGYNCAIAHAASVGLGANATSTAGQQVIFGGYGGGEKTEFIMGGGRDLETSPSDTAWRIANSSGTNIAAADLTITPGRGTGTGAPGELKLRTANTLTTGSTLQTPYDRITVAADGLIKMNGSTNAEGSRHVVTGYVETDGGADTGTLLTLPLPTGANYAGGLVEILIACQTDTDEHYYYSRRHIRLDYGMSTGATWTATELTSSPVTNSAGTTNDWAVAYVFVGDTMEIRVTDEADAHSAGWAHWSGSVVAHLLEAP